MSILLADDDALLAKFLSKSLESEGYSVHTALDETSVFHELSRRNYELIILDLNFGETDGLKLLERLRSEGLKTPVLVLSARNRISDRVASLNLGADDYVTKPFSFQELAARANAILRRHTNPSLNILRVENLELDPLTRKVSRGGREIKLSPKEFDLLQILMRHGGETVSRQALLKQGWGTSETDSNLVDVYVNYLRRKVDFGHDKLIATIRGEGYRLGSAASLHHAGRTHADKEKDAQLTQRFPHPALVNPSSSSELPASTLRAMIHSLAHDLAQPLTSVRCFLEMLAQRRANAIQPGDLKTIEQQADRAIALIKAISAAARETPEVTVPWISLETIFNEVLADFAVLQHADLLTLQKIWDPSLHVSSNPVLRQVLILLLSKVSGRNAQALTLTVAAQSSQGRCHLDLRWRPADSAQKPLQDAAAILMRDRVTLKEMVQSLHGELAISDGECLVTMRLPAAQGQSSAAGFVH